MNSIMTRPFKALALMAFLVALFSPGSLLAQEARGKITGKVRDAGKAVVPGAAVKVINIEMGTTVSSPTNEAGIFLASFLIPGTYQITVEASGFKKYVRDGIVVSVNDSLEVDIDLEVGSVDQTVTVTGDAPLLETTSGSMGQVVDARRIAELPIGHGDPYALMGLAGGVSFSRDQRLDRPFEPTHIVGYSIDGTRANRSDLTIDGASSTSTANAGEVISSFVPPQDLVQEFKVQTATFDASFGNTEGGVTNLSIKSGTNQFHGTASYSNFTPGTSANDFYANRANQPISDFYYHRFGGTVGGPVWIPKVYNGQNKTFFMYGMEGIREARPRNNGTLSIPTDKMRNGDFSDLLAIGPQYQIYNPFTRVAIAGGRFQQSPFVGNIIPQQLINPIAKKFVDTYLPRATSTATAADGLNNFQQPGLKERAKYYSHTIRIDHAFSEKHRIFGRTSWYDRNSDYNNYYGNLATGSLFSFISRQGVFDDVYTISPTLILNVRYGYNRFIRFDAPNPESLGFDLSSLGFPASYTNLISKDA
ncbi:MAG: carboxypeptidase-like regulatory domain-containing protein, partial [Acidobacteriota bacterium]